MGRLLVGNTRLFECPDACRLRLAELVKRLHGQSDGFGEPALTVPGVLPRHRDLAPERQVIAHGEDGAVGLVEVDAFQLERAAADIGRVDHALQTTHQGIYSTVDAAYGTVVNCVFVDCRIRKSANLPARVNTNGL
ncbi:MAG: hypothetical protein G01um1014106_696 [Parcubacteria group bacterium Gr01-1014_106]|nr:MAG: hypothetical protein G01um1014106_696 [Parcubacteria group bacterium Gr01-1014_106]